MTTQSDATTSFTTVINEIHREIHEGDHFFNSPLFSAAVLGNMVYTTANTFVHMIISVSSDQPGIAILYQDPVLSAQGAVSEIFNSNLPSAKVASVAAKQDATVTTPGDQLFPLIVGSSGSPASRAGGASGRESEIILKPGTQYLLRFTPDAAADFTINIEFYEKDTNGTA